MEDMDYLKSWPIREHGLFGSRLWTEEFISGMKVFYFSKKLTFEPYQVFHSGIPITLVPLDATNTIPINKEFFYEFEHRQGTYEAQYCFKSLKMARDTWFNDEFYTVSSCNLFHLISYIFLCDCYLFFFIHVSCISLFRAILCGILLPPVLPFPACAMIRMVNMETILLSLNI